MALQMSRGRGSVSSAHGAARITAVRVPVAARMIVKQTSVSRNSIMSSASLSRSSRGMHAPARANRAPSRIADAAQMEPLAPEPEEEDFDLLSDKIAVLQTQVLEELKGCSVWLIGMMGSGKSTTGKMLANTLRYSFIDTDTLIEAAHEKRPVADIFAKDGEPYFRKVESQVVRELSAYKSMVISTGGGAVLLPENWGYMHNGIVAWLSGEPDLLARRVAADGVSKRPLLATPTPINPFDGSSSSSSDSTSASTSSTFSSSASTSSDASTSTTTDTASSSSSTPAESLSAVEARLTTMLAERTKFYENADIIIPLTGFGMDVETGAPTAVVMFRLLKSLLVRIQTTKAEREEKRNFTIEGAETQRPRSMRVVKTEAEAAAALSASGLGPDLTQH